MIGAGNAGRPLNRFGRTATTTFLTPTGTGQYNSLQTRLERRFARGVQFNASYVWAKTIGPVDNSDSSPSIKALDYFDLNRVVRSFDRTHTMHLSTIWAPVGKGRKWATSGASSWILGGWQLNNIVSLMTGTPFTVSASGNSLNLPGSSQQADQVKPEVQILGGAGRGQ